MNEVRNIIVGVELGEKTSQICYYDREEGEPVSISVKAGASHYAFPTCLSKKPGEDSYHYGLEAEYFSAQKGEILIDDLYERCCREDEENLEELPGAAYLLSVFFRQILQMLGVNHPLKNISCIAVTVPKINKILIEHIKEAFGILNFSKESYFILDYKESYYYYTISQRPELWSRKVGLFDITCNQATFYSLIMDRQSRPFRASVQQGDSCSLDEDAERRDEEFCQLIRDSFGNDIYSGVFLVGDGFDKSWANRSIPMLCKGQRHVFYGNNLFCKGACYGARERQLDTHGKDTIFVSEQMTSMEVGMEMLIHGAPAYYPLLEAGLHWYEATCDIEILLDEAKDLIFMAGKPRSSEMKRYSMALPNLPDRPAKATRLALHLEFVTPVSCEIQVTDLGLGELFPGSGMVWKEELVQE